MEKETYIRKRLIQYSLMNIFTAQQLERIATCLMIEPDLSLRDIFLTRTQKRPKNVYQLLDQAEKLARELDYERIKNQYHARGVTCSTIFDSDYPLALKEIYQPPVVLYYQGSWELTRRRRLGIVGSRKSTPYGEKVLHELLPPLIERGVVTVSGLAEGIDRDVHSQTLSLKGSTIAIIGTGIDQVYPRQHQALQAKIGKEQLIISEYPLGTPPKRHHFPMRNRIIAGLCQGVLVVEAKHRSGSLITANVALQENREVFAVPGSILDPAYSGTNELIRAGAKLVISASDIFEEMEDLWLLK